MGEQTDVKDTMRLDKWLWCARFFKTRALAAEAIRGSKIRFNDAIPKPSRMIQAGDHLQIRKGPFLFDISVRKLCNHRCSASDAALLYEETPVSMEARHLLATQLKAEAAIYPKTRGRPTKRDRRDIVRFSRQANTE